MSDDTEPGPETNMALFPVYYVEILPNKANLCEWSKLSKSAFLKRPKPWCRFETFMGTILQFTTAG